LRLDDGVKENKEDFFVLTEWNRIQKCPEKGNYKMKLHTNEQMCHIAFSENDDVDFAK
jgi:hypothetical protein